MDAYNQKILGRGEAGIQDRLKWQWDLKADQAAACVQCEEECTQLLPIRDCLNHIASLPGDPS